MEMPKVKIFVENGCVTDIETTHPLKVQIVDLDQKRVGEQYLDTFIQEPTEFEFLPLPGQVATWKEGDDAEDVL